MKILLIIICGILITGQISPGFTSETSNAGIKNEKPAGQNDFESCGKGNSKGCSKSGKKTIKGKSYTIKEKPEAPEQK